MSARVSVLTPTYNHEKFIGDCIRSVIAQTFSDWEMIVVDDGSTDGTGEVVKSFDDPRIQYVRKANSGIEGLSETYNAGLELATGEAVAILEGDDYWPGTKLAIQTSDFDDPAVVLSSGLTLIDTGESVGKPLLTPSAMPPEDVRNNRPVGRAAKHMISPDTLTFTFPVSTMIRTETLRRIGGFRQPPYMLVVDFPTFLRLTIEGEFRFHDQVLGCWRRHVTSTTLSRMPEIIDGAYRYAFEFLQEFRDKLPISDEELDEIESQWDERNAMKCILRGRLLNKMGDRKLAARAFRESLLYRTGRKTHQVALLAAKISEAGVSVDPLYKLFGRVPLDEAITLNTGDQTVSSDDMKRERFVGRWRRATGKG